MDRKEFERIRDAPGKEILGDIVLRKFKENSAVLTCKKKIDNRLGYKAFLHIKFNQETSEKNLTVSIDKVGPVCRLDINSRPHKPCSRNHKHSLRTEKCPSENLTRDVSARDELANKEIDEIFRIFCNNAKIVHNGNFVWNDREDEPCLI